MIKTIREWYNELPQYIKEKALKYAEEDGSLDREEDTLCNALNMGFIWENTKEGVYYWEAIYKGNYPKEIELPEIITIEGVKYKRI